MTTEFNIIKYNKEKAQERRKKIVEQICVYQKNATHAGDILRELWDISYIKNAVNHTVCSTYKLYGMCELAPVYDEIRAAIKDRYRTEWSDTIINNLRDVYTVEDTFD